VDCIGDTAQGVEFLLGGILVFRGVVLVVRAKVIGWMSGEALLLGDGGIFRRRNFSKSLDVGRHVANRRRGEDETTDGWKQRGGGM